jgi:hypothetical protein
MCDQSHDKNCYQFFHPLLVPLKHDLDVPQTGLDDTTKFYILVIDLIGKEF